MRIAAVIITLVLLGVPAWAQSVQELIEQGGQVFADNCAQCHRSNGAGLPGTFPALNRDPVVVGDPAPVIATILNGRKGTLMPSWKDKLDDRQVAAVVSYIRQAWSNRARPVTPAAVARIRNK